MGYEMKYEGEIFFKADIVEEHAEKIVELISANFGDYDLSKNDRNVIESVFVYGSGRYNDTEWYSFFNEIVSYAETGEIRFVGEDDTHWRFILRKGSNTFVEENGYIEYETRKRTILIYDKDTSDHEPLFFLRATPDQDIEGVIRKVWREDGYDTEMLMDAIYDAYPDVTLYEIEEYLPF